MGDQDKKAPIQQTPDEAKPLSEQELEQVAGGYAKFEAGSGELMTETATYKTGSPEALKKAYIIKLP